jgi:hypothetical protein
MTQSRVVIMATVQIMIPLVALTVRLAGIKRTARWLTNNTNIVSSPEVNNITNAMRLFQIQRKAVASSLWRGNCLSRSLVLHWLLHRNGVHSEFCLGVCTQPSFKAHAWITFQGRPLNASRQALSNYQLVSDYTFCRLSEFK